MDEFAQSREDDDLFADDFEPATQLILIEEGALPHQGRAPQSKPPPPSGPAKNGRGGREQGQGQERRRGRGGAGGGLNQSRYVPKEEQTSTAPAADTRVETLPKQASLPSTTTEPVTVPTNTQPPTEPSKPTTHAVRGDRSATGGPLHKKLTEEELNAKLEKMKILNAERSERFRLSEADSAAFEQKEKEIALKRVQEQKNSRVMDMERAKNRERKLQAQGGREWDSEKREEDIVDGKSRGRSSEFLRGDYGGVIRGRGVGGRLAGSRFSGGDEGAGGGFEMVSRGRGDADRGRGQRGRGARGRGGVQTQPATIPGREEFPALPTPAPSKTPERAPIASKLASTEVAAPLPALDPKSPIGGGDWAEEMATPVEEKKLSI